jgi:Tol biopolymer transport system component
VITFTESVSAKSYPDWSPFSDQFVFSYDPGLTNASEVYIVHPHRNGTMELTRLTGLHDQGDLYYPKWSPDDEYLAFLGPVGAPVGLYLSITDFSGNHQTYLQSSQVSDYAPYSRWNATPGPDGIAWSRTGRYLAVASSYGWVPGNLYVVEISGQTAERYFGPDGYSSAMLEHNFYTPLFSSDGKTLYFVSVPEVEGDLEWPLGGIFSVRVADVLNAASREAVEVVPISPSDQVAGFPDLSADDKWLLYTVRQGEATEIWLQSIDGVYREQLIADGFLNMRPAWRPTLSGE